MNELEPNEKLHPKSGPPDPSEQSTTSESKRGRKPIEIADETRDEVVQLSQFYGTRQIAPRVGLSRKLVRRVLAKQEKLSPRQPQDEPSSKLEPFREQIEARVRKGLTTKRILREIRQLGYGGERTILGEYVRELQSKLTIEPTPKATKRRFETKVAQELQIDWSPYLVPIGGRMVKVHALGCLLAWSRKLHIRFYRDERQSTLLEGLACAFQYFDGVTAKVVVDNMATAVLGRIGPSGKPIWHERFADFVTYYGTEPFACKVRDPNRKGKKEKSFRLLYEDFLKGSEFDSWEDLHERLRIWLDETPETANLRIHGTTRRVPNEAFEQEHPMLIRLPDGRFPVYDQTVRVVDDASTLSIEGTAYTVPAALASRSVGVRLYAEHFEVLDRQGRIAFSRRYVPDSEKGRLVIDPTHYANLPQRPRAGSDGQRLDEGFVRRFPQLSPLVDGLKHRMKTLAPVHISSLLKLCDKYGQEAFVDAATKAQGFRRFDAFAVKRILEDSHPEPEQEPIAVLSGHGPLALGQVDSGSLDDFAGFDDVCAQADHDSSTPTGGEPHGT